MQEEIVRHLPFAIRFLASSFPAVLSADLAESDRAHGWRGKPTDEKRNLQSSFSWYLSVGLPRHPWVLRTFRGCPCETCHSSSAEEIGSNCA